MGNRNKCLQSTYADTVQNCIRPILASDKGISACPNRFVYNFVLDAFRPDHRLLSTVSIHPTGRSLNDQVLKLQKKYIINIKASKREGTKITKITNKDYIRLH